MGCVIAAMITVGAVQAQQQRAVDRQLINAGFEDDGLMDRDDIFHLKFN